MPEQTVTAYAIEEIARKIVDELIENGTLDERRLEARWTTEELIGTLIATWLREDQDINAEDPREVE